MTVVNLETKKNYYKWIVNSDFLQLGAATRLQGITPAAIVHLLNYVTHRKGPSTAKQPKEREKPRVGDASVAQ